MAVKLESGAKLAVEGPAEFRIVSNNGARMVRGRATIRVPGKIKGFTLDTPDVFRGDNRTKRRDRHIGI